MIIKLSKQDLMRGRTIQPNWYRVIVTKFEARHPKSGSDSMNYVYTIRFPSVDNYELDHTFNTKALGFMGPFIAAIKDIPLNQVIQQLDSNTLDFDTDEAIGKEIQVKLINEPYEGRLLNKIDGWLPKSAEVPF